jgi:glycosyltransferase involved in cell wall biosynthesis
MSRPLVIVSLRYVPGFWQHMESFAAGWLRQGGAVRFLMSSGYQWMNRRYDGMADYTGHSQGLFSTLVDSPTFFFKQWPRIRRIWRANPPGAIFLESWHPLNIALVRLAKALFPGVPVIMSVHEPFKDEKWLYGKKALIFYIIEWFQGLILPHVDCVVLHSSRGLRLFEQRYPGYNEKKRRIPLQFEDAGLTGDEDRRYISFLGRADAAKGIELFFDLVGNCARTNPDWRFQIVTPTNIDSHVEKLSPGARERLRVVSRPQLSDAELRQGAANSLAVMALYKETMQSGVIPVALMKGTPVVGTRIEGLTEWLEDRKTGVIVSANPGTQELKAAISYIMAHFNEMTGPCREYYLRTFDGSNWEKEYGWIRELILT